MSAANSVILRNAKVLDPRAGTVDGPCDVVILDGRDGSLKAAIPGHERGHLAVANLEAPLTHENSLVRYAKPWAHRGDPEASAPALERAGIDEQGAWLWRPDAGLRLDAWLRSRSGPHPWDQVAPVVRSLVRRLVVEATGRGVIGVVSRSLRRPDDRRRSRRIRAPSTCRGPRTPPPSYRERTGTPSTGRPLAARRAAGTPRSRIRSSALGIRCCPRPRC